METILILRIKLPNKKGCFGYINDHLSPKDPQKSISIRLKDPSKKRHTLSKSLHRHNIMIYMLLQRKNIKNLVPDSIAAFARYGPQ